MIEKTDIVLEKQRDFSDVINVTFAFIRQEFKLLFKTIAIFSFIPLLGLSIISVFYSAETLQEALKGVMNNVQGVEMPNWGLYFLMILLAVLAQVFISGLLYDYLYLYKTRGRGNFTSSDVARLFAKDIWGIVGFQILASIIILFAFMFFLIPGIYLSVPLSLIIVIRVMERNGFGTSFSRCFRLVRNRWWLTLGLLIILYIIIAVMGMIFQIPMMVYSGVKAVAIAQQGGIEELNRGVMLILSILSTFGGYWLYSILYLGLAFHYLSLREEKDQNSIINRINQIGEETADEVL